jgi:hypothetical protein
MLEECMMMSAHHYATLQLDNQARFHHAHKSATRAIAVRSWVISRLGGVTAPERRGHPDRRERRRVGRCWMKRLPAPNLAGTGSSLQLEAGGCYTLASSVVPKKRAALGSARHVPATACARAFRLSKSVGFITRSGVRNSSTTPRQHRRSPACEGWALLLSLPLPDSAARCASATARLASDYLLPCWLAKLLSVCYTGATLK